MTNVANCGVPFRNMEETNNIWDCYSGLMHSVIKNQPTKQTPTNDCSLYSQLKCHTVDADSHLPGRAGEKKCKQDLAKKHFC